MNPKVTFGEAFKLFWKNYFNFKGRSRRSEYWFMQLWHLIFLVPALMVFVISLIIFILSAGVGSEVLSVFGMTVLVIAAIYFILYSVATFIPNLAIAVRRFHDTDRTMFIPILSVVLGIISFIIQLIWNINDPNGENGWAALFILLFSLVQCAVSIYQIVITCLNSKFNKNKYGESPKFKGHPNS
ncbi:DUF805 domain-containing protein [Staphylococcus taiwanensis]|nr:DUF805 domain-containing protein [Staphylococcus taiwanensis]